MGVCGNLNSSSVRSVVCVRVCRGTRKIGKVGLCGVG